MTKIATTPCTNSVDKELAEIHSRLKHINDHYANLIWQMPRISPQENFDRERLLVKKATLNNILTLMEGVLQA